MKIKLSAQRYSAFVVCVQLFFSCLVLSACTSNSAKSERSNQFDTSFKPLVLNDKAPIKFEFKPPKGRLELVHVYSRTITRSYTTDQIMRERDEVVDFSVKSETLVVDAKSGNRTTLVETTRKEGTTDLYDLGFPELGESIEYIFTPKGEVKKAGNFPSNSIFFLPPLALPDRPISVGDTWEYKGEWISLRNGLPLSVDVINIFRRAFQCGKNNRCAEIEISGQVNVPESLKQNVKLQSLVTGRMLYNLDTGGIVWSDVRNREKMEVPDEGRLEIFTCTETVQEEPKNEHWPWRKRPDCDAFQDLPTNVPGYKEK